MTSLSSLSKARLASYATCACITALLICVLLDEVPALILDLLAGLTLCCMLGVLWFMAKTSKSVHQTIDVCAAVTRGDFEARIVGIRERGDLGKLMWTIDDLIDRTDAYVRETSASMDYVSRNHYFRRIVETGMVGAFLSGTKTINAATNAIAAKVSDFKGVADKFETTIFGVVDGVASAATELDATSRSMESTATATEEQATAVGAAAEEASVSVQTVASAAEELSSSITEIGTQANRALEVTRRAVGETETSHERLERLQQSAERIGEVVALITDVAAQTNLLALNATIEAARAGEAGKGFAVVAQEVKQLANQTAKATEEISAQIIDMQDASREVVGSFESVGNTIQEINQTASAISAAVEQQTAATQEIANSVVHASAGTREATSNIEKVTLAASDTKNAARDVLEASGQLSSQAEKLRSEVNQFLVEIRKVV